MTVTLDIYRAVQVVHNLLRAVREAEATKTFHTYGMPWQGGQQASGFTSGGPPAWPAGRQFGGCPSCGRSDCVALACARLMPLHVNVMLNAREIARQTGLPLHKDEKGDEYVSLKDTERLAAPQLAVAAGWVKLPGQLPEPGTPVLVDIGKKFPIRAKWAAKHTVEAADDDTDWAEYDEATDTYYCPEGWYEWNQHEETHWSVSETPRAWCELPKTLPSAPSTEGDDRG